MTFCKNCGANIDDLAVMCPTCGTNVGVQYSAQLPRKGTLNTGFLIWSIINILVCCMPLGVAGLIFTITAQNKPTLEEEQKALKTAKILNLIGTICGVVIYIVLIILLVLAPAFFERIYSNY